MNVDWQGICPNCFSGSMSGGKCSKCGYEDAPVNPGSLQLPKFFVLYDRYVLGKVLGAGGFGITYKAYDILNNSLCAVKEFVPFGISTRSMDGITLQAASRGHEDNFEHGKKRFLEEADILKQLSNIPEVVHITDYFSENNTVYFVMEFLNGITLKKMVSAMGGKIPYRHAVSIISDAGRALEQVHRRAGIFHRDISPENIMIDGEGRVKIIDFGSAKYLTGKRSQNLSVVLKPGFAPLEQYSSTGKQGSFTDVYALAGTFYYIVSGVMVPEAPDRLSGSQYKKLKELSLGIDEKVSDEVDRALELNYRDRTQTIGEFISGISPESVSRRGRGNSANRRDWQNVRQGEKDSQEIRGKQQIRELPSKMRKPVKRPFMIGKYYNGGEKKWTLPPGKVIRVGRSGTRSDIILVNDPHISKVHFEITYNEESAAFYIRDRSTNGVYYMGKRLIRDKVYKLRDKDVFVLGNQIYIFKVKII